MRGQVIRCGTGSRTGNDAFKMKQDGNSLALGSVYSLYEAALPERDRSPTTRTSRPR